MANTEEIISIIANIHNRANKLIIEELKKHKLDNLAPSHGDILFHLYENEEGIAMNKITSYINKDKSTLTALVNKLVAMDLVEKIKCKEDSRSTLLKLTAKGQATKPIVIDQISRRLLDTTYKNFSTEEKEQLCKLLGKIKENFKQT